MALRKFAYIMQDHRQCNQPKEEAVEVVLCHPNSLRHHKEDMEE